MVVLKDDWLWYYYNDNCKSHTLRKTAYYEDLRHLLRIDLFAGQFHGLSKQLYRNVPHTTVCIHVAFSENSSVEYLLLSLNSLNFSFVDLHRFPYMHESTNIFHVLSK